MMNEAQTTTVTAKQAADRKMMRRDGEIYVALGIFILAVGFPVLVGTYYATEPGTSQAVHAHPAIVNFICSVVLLLIGAASIGYGRIILARHKRLT